MLALNKTSLLAPCGMNCAVCRAYLREKNKCVGCRGPDTGKAMACVRCKIKNCKFFKNGKAKFCFQCDIFPCDKLEHLDKRYRTKYHMSMIENLKNIENNGVRKFLSEEKSRWTCPKCGGTICVHKGACYNCLMQKYIIRTATANDYKGIAMVHVSTWQYSFKEIVPDNYLDKISLANSEKRWKKKLSESVDGSNLFVATKENGEIIGFCFGCVARDQDIGFDSEIVAIYLLPEYQRKNIGKKLLHSFVEWLISKGYKTLYLCTLQENPARKFYESIGGELLENRKIREMGGKKLTEVAYGWRDLPKLLGLLM